MSNKLPINMKKIICRIVAAILFTLFFVMAVFSLLGLAAFSGDIFETLAFLVVSIIFIDYAIRGKSFLK